MHLIFHPMDPVTARRIITWRYDEPYSLYNPSSDNGEADVASLLDPANHYYAITDEHGVLIAYRCFGPDACVAGGDYSSDALDTGGGLRPDLTGQGLGRSVIQAGLDFGRRTFAPRAFRVTVAAFNQRALRTCAKLGFQPVQCFRRPADGLEFVVLMRDA